MAITLTQMYQGFTFGAAQWGYLYEPKTFNIANSDLTATKLFVDVRLFDMQTNALVEIKLKYTEFDINPGQDIIVDFAEIARQVHDHNVYKFATVDDIADDTFGWKASAAEYKYQFRLYDDADPIGSIRTGNFLWVIGGRSLKDNVNGGSDNLIYSNSIILNEYQRYGVENTSRWKDFKWPVIDAGGWQLPTDIDTRPQISLGSNGSGIKVCGAWLIWKSRYGGWMWWGFESKIDTPSHKYMGDLEVGQWAARDPYTYAHVETNYLGIETGFSTTLKSYGLTELELKAVSGILASPAIYICRSSQYDSLELMRLTSASIPLKNNGYGGNFSVTLQSISKETQRTR